MQANWSLMLNILLLIAVIIAIGRMLKARRQSSAVINHQPSVGQIDSPAFEDIIAVRKVDQEPKVQAIPEPVYVVHEKPLAYSAPPPSAKPSLHEKQAISPKLSPQEKIMVKEEPAARNLSHAFMVFLLAKENRQFAGYELLQTVLAAGLRFGEGNLFHRHQYPNGQGPVLCSLAAATSTGVFDLQNIGAFSVRGLCLFMQTSGNSTIDSERFSIMLETAKQLSEGLDAHLLDEQRKPLTDAALQRYYQRLQLEEVAD
ncbi:cell division protein ZipA C-terminal FtsZ-binding domain-containing protein [Legionella sp. 27cVA30]|uniref:cell division protein ZipA C-terminal FtsZ-binding domain-containing protein n=1 Tax=Legionella sp. 27cVA30 TaxID=2905657 RepID=UPI0020A10CA2|nr:cell division protein ZipA C-terminal FtsZ-binding domain-containing protein [Legionella sp. 27cVA30]MCP0913954.1 cell division protein ZipA C-terminal FtsZ-binding domain-containing protein [Legionella sp. 27cVA30]